MRTLTKTIATGVAIISLTGATAGVAFADMPKPVPLQAQSHNTKFVKLQKEHKYFHKYHRENSFARSWFKALHRSKQLTPIQAKMVAKAAVILYGDSSMKVGKITAIPSKLGHSNYRVEINQSVWKESKYRDDERHQWKVNAT